MFTKNAHHYLPPVAFDIARKLRGYDAPNVLFDSDDRVFKDAVADSNVYGEYGCGKSTTWVLANTSAQIIAVDTSKEWVEVVKNSNASHRDRLTIGHADVGDVGMWGRPLTYERKDSFSHYTDYLWRQALTPDVVLVDGRFRVCCFLTSLKFAPAGTKIIFDDYINRPHYHFVENYAKRSLVCGRQCLFIVPPKDGIDMDALDKDIDGFRYVMD